MNPISSENNYVAFFHRVIVGINFRQICEIKQFYKTFEIAFIDKLHSFKLFLAQNVEEDENNRFKLDFLARIHKIDPKIDFDIIFKKYCIYLKSSSINLVSYLDSQFPSVFFEARPMPFILYCKGNLDLLQSGFCAVGIVGARKISSYSVQTIATVLAPVIQNSQIIIISGLAAGVDTIAHQKAIELGFPTIAFIGSGFEKNIFYPASNFQLMEQIIDAGGLVVSQFFPDQKAFNYNFPIRNQLIALQSDLIWVVQASIKSGSLITGNLALEFGKTLCTTPASVFDPLFTGNIQLIKNGAQIITETEDLIQLLNLKTQAPIDFRPKMEIPKITQTEMPNIFIPASVIDISNLNGLSKQIFEMIKMEKSISIESIYKNLPTIEKTSINQELSMLELDDLIKINADNFFTLN